MSARRASNCWTGPEAPVPGSLKTTTTASSGTRARRSHLAGTRHRRPGHLHRKLQQGTVSLLAHRLCCDPTGSCRPLATIRRTMDFGTPTFYQEVLADFIGEGHFARHIRRMRVLYQERRTVLVHSLAQELGSLVEVIGDEAGLQLAVTLPSAASDREIAERAAHHNLWIWPLSTSYQGEATLSGFILGFGNTPVPEIPRNVRKLRNLLVTR